MTATAAPEYFVHASIPATYEKRTQPTSDRRAVGNAARYLAGQLRGFADLDGCHLCIVDLSQRNAFRAGKTLAFYRLTAGEWQHVDGARIEGI